MVRRLVVEDNDYRRTIVATGDLERLEERLGFIFQKRELPDGTLVENSILFDHTTAKKLAEDILSIYN